MAVLSEARLFLVLVVLIAGPAWAGGTIPPPSAPVQPGPGGPSGRVELLPPLRKYLDGLRPELERIPDDRREQLDRLAQYIQARRAAGEPARLVAICTHNSRRSHLWQAFAAAAAAHQGVDGVEAFSGGTEVTAFNPRAVRALERAGFEVSAGSGSNPRYQVRFAGQAPPLVAFSKKYDEAPNPTAGFAAIMTCSQADASCPIIRGAAVRVRLPHDDPKQSDGTPEESNTYDARARAIAAEALYVFSKVQAR